MIEVLPPDSLRGPRRLAAILSFASGFSAIAYQVLWIQQSGLWLGQESAAVVAVVAAFLGGLALGSVLVARVVERARHPERWYAACEFLVAVWAVVLVFAQASVDAMLSAWVGADAAPWRQWLVSFGGTLLLLLPATVAMGATLPAMERCLRGLGRPQAFSVLYAANTAGAMVGALGAAFWLVPQLGLMRTALTCGAVNVLCAVGALALPVQAVESASLGRASAESDSAEAETGRSEVTTPPVGAVSTGALATLLLATGWMGIGFELLVVRALSQVAENTVYTYAIILAVYLGSTSLGAALHSRLVRGFGAARLRQTLLMVLAWTVVVAAGVISQASPLHQWLLRSFPAGVAGALFAEAGLALIVFLPATFCMGLLFPQLVTDAKSAGISPGKALAVNTLGGSLAPVFTLLLLPLWGLRAVLLLVAGGYGLLAMALCGRVSRWVWGGAVALAVVMVLVPPLQFARLSDGDHVLVENEGRQATVSVIETADGTRTLHIDNRQQEGSNRTTYADGRQALLPLLLHPAPSRALFLGVGTGVTSSVATLDPELQVDAVELVPQVVEATRWFSEAVPAEANLAHRQFIVADARRWVRAGNSQYDLIVADNFHPARSGTGALYSQAHFAAVKRRLAPGGLFCQWLPLHQLDLVSLASIVRSYQAVFPEAVAMLATNSLDTPTIGLVAFREGKLPGPLSLEHRLAALHSAVRNDFDFPDALAVAGAVVAGPDALKAFAANAVANTDDRPIVAYRAPFVTYAAKEKPRDRLLELVGVWNVRPDEVMNLTESERVWGERAGRYWQARNRYLQVGRNVKPVAGLQAMLSQVQEPLLSVLRISPEFQPAFDPLWNMAQALQQQDPVAANALLDKLQALAAARDALSGSL